MKDAVRGDAGKGGNLIAICGVVGWKVDEKTWSDFSLSSAMRGMEDETSLYSLADLKESFHEYETATKL